MSKKIFLENLVDHVGEEITELFFVKGLTRNYNRQGNKWTQVVICDRTGEVCAKIWSEFESKFEACDQQVCEVTGKVDLYNGVAGIAITKIEVAKEYSMNDFAVGMDDAIRNEYLKQLHAYIDKIQSPELHSLVSSIFTDKNEESMASLPGGVRYHHAYNGGQLAHTLEVTKLSVAAANVHEQYSAGKPYVNSQVNMDLLIAGALLHDIGKLTEYRSFPMASRTVRGHLVGHLTEGVIVISCYNRLLPNEKRVQDLTELLHIVESSHGEAGGMLPSTLEAIIVHNADMMSAQMDGYHCAFFTEDVKHPDNKKNFVSSGMLGTTVYRREV